MPKVMVNQCKECGQFEEDLQDGLCISCEDSANSIREEQERQEHTEALRRLYDSDGIYHNDHDFFENDWDTWFDKKMCRCGQDEVYSETLTNGLCLNCYNEAMEADRWMEIEMEHDRHQGIS